MELLWLRCYYSTFSCWKTEKQRIHLCFFTGSSQGLPYAGSLYWQPHFWPSWSLWECLRHVHAAHGILGNKNCPTGPWSVPRPLLALAIALYPSLSYILICCSIFIIHVGLSVPTHRQKWWLLGTGKDKRKIHTLCIDLGEGKNKDTVLWIRSTLVILATYRRTSSLVCTRSVLGSP